MGDLFWNKIAGSALAALLVVFVVNEVGHVVYHPHEPHEDAYPWEVADGGHGGEVVEEGPLDLGAMLAAADASSGERAARQCVSCHTFDQGGAELQGPNLWNIVNRTAGSAAGFNYSSAMTEFGAPWTYEALNEYLTNPRSYVSGTNMSFAGIRSDEQRVNLIAYLRTLSDAPAPLPEPLAPETDGGEEPAEGEDSEAPAEEAAEPEE